MIEIIISTVIGFFLGLMMVLDVKFHKIPSILPTTVILLLGIINIQNIPFGILGFMFGLILHEFQYIHSNYDIKILVIIGLTIPSVNYFLIFMGLIVSLSLIYQIGLRIQQKQSLDNIIVPYTPIYLIVYTLLELNKYWSVVNI